MTDSGITLLLVACAKFMFAMLFIGCVSALIAQRLETGLFTESEDNVKRRF